MTQADRMSEQLPELIRELTLPLYALFNFFEPPLQVYREVVKEMRGGK